MGLAQKKERTKLSRDPNNNVWSKNTSRFGHRVLVSQGWAPGGTLGAPSSSYASTHYTAASASHIRVAPKEGTRGLGSRTGRPDRDETFGLELLSGLLGRLNGKEEAVIEEEKSIRRDVKLLTYHESKYGTSSFVFGGYLVGDDIQENLDTTPLSEAPSEISEEKGTKKMKRKRGDETSETKLEDKDVVSTSANHSEQEEKRRLKREKKAKREEKRARKEAKRQKKIMTESSNPETASTSEQDVGQNAHHRSQSSISTPVSTSGTSTPLFAVSGRQMVRQRYIQQKRMAVMDEKALKEIFMVKSK